MWVLLTISLIASAFALQNATTDNSDVQRLDVPSLDLLAQKFLAEISSLSAEASTKLLFVRWAHDSNITEENQQKLIEAKSELAAWNKDISNLVQTWKDHIPFLTNETLKDYFEGLTYLGKSALPPDELEELNTVVAEMMNIFSQAQICDYNDPEKCDLSLSPDITEILRSSRNYSELTHVWKSWRDNTGKKMRGLYQDYVRLSNKAAKLNDKNDLGEMWLHSYGKDIEGFRENVADIFRQLKPLYQQLHAYVRRKLRESYGPEVVTERGPIPANLMGDVWAQQWETIFDLLVPYPGKSFPDVSEEMQKQGYTPKKMFEMADDFFASLNLTRMPSAFWEESIIEKPSDRDIACYPTAWDFCNGKDYRIKMCTEVNMKDFVVIHHEMGHIQYFLQYKNLDYFDRTGANPGFHEAVGEVLAMSVSTPKHLHKIGLLHTLVEDEEADINFLLKSALYNIVFLPFSYLVDLWRWNVLSGKTAEENWNCAWWDLRYELQGVKPPVVRTENDFDPGCKYHVPAGVSYVRYFVATVIQYQFHKAMCLKAGEYDPLDPSKPLHRCDIYQSAEAGNLFGDMLQMGQSKPWGDAMAAITGQKKMDASVMREYFKPLEDWLIKDNLKHNEFIGWEKDGEYCV